QFEEVSSRKYASGLLYKATCVSCESEFEDAITVLVHDLRASEFTYDNVSQSDGGGSINLAAIHKDNHYTQFGNNILNANSRSRSGAVMNYNGAGLTSVGDSISWTHEDVDLLTRK